MESLLDYNSFNIIDYRIKSNDGTEALATGMTAKQKALFVNIIYRLCRLRQVWLESRSCYKFCVTGILTLSVINFKIALSEVYKFVSYSIMLNI